MERRNMLQARTSMNQNNNVSLLGQIMGVLKVKNSWSRNLKSIYVVSQVSINDL